MKWQRQVQWQAKDTMGDFKQSSKLKVKSFIFCSVDKTAHKLSMKWQTYVQWWGQRQGDFKDNSSTTVSFELILLKV
jgi:hypothetical protein